MNHARVATAELLRNLRTHQICLQCTESDDVLLQLEIDSIHVPNFALLLHSQLPAFGFHVELLINGVEHLADILEDVPRFAVDVLEALHFASLSNFLPLCSSASPSTQDCSARSSITALGPCNCTMKFLPSGLLKLLSCSFRSVSALLPQVHMLLCRQIPSVCERLHGGFDETRPSPTCAP